MQVVTALFNINREENDGRTIDEYLSWLHSLLEMFPEAVVFHDGSADRLVLRFIKAQFIHINIHELHFFTQYSAIVKICTRYLDLGKEDLVYLNPQYGIVTMGKFELMRRALAYSEDQHFLWVDAGVLRLYKPHLVWTYKNFKNIVTYDFDGALVEIDLLPRRGRLWPKMPSIGSSDRLIGTSVMLVDRKTIISLDASTTEMAQHWIDQGEWDTEQVAVARLWKQGFHFSFCIQEWRAPTSILRALHDKYSDLRSFPFLPTGSIIVRIIRWIIN